MKLYHDGKEIDCRIERAWYTGEFPVDFLTVKLYPMNDLFFRLFQKERRENRRIVVESGGKRELYVLVGVKDYDLFDFGGLIEVELGREV